jgi:lactate permease
MAGWRGVLGVWPALAVCGGSFALVQFLIANYHGPWLVDVAGGLVSLVCLALFLRLWQPRHTWHFPHERPAPPAPAPPAPQEGVLRGTDVGVTAEPGPHPQPLSHKGRGEEEGDGPPRPLVLLTTRTVLSAWVPWLLLTAFVFAWGLPWVKQQLAPLGLRAEVPALHRAVLRTPPVVPLRHAEDAVYEFNFPAGTGTGIFLAALASACWLRVGVRRFLRVLAVTAYRLRWPLFTIACMLAIAFTTRYAGLDATLGLAFTRTGALYPLFAALLGWLGVALTGSDTSSNALFGGLQTITAGRLAADGVLPLSAEQAKVLLASANSTGGVMGKMIDAQSIVVSAAATQQPGQEGPILRFVFGHSLALALLMGLLVLAQAYWWTAAIP